LHLLNASKCINWPDSNAQVPTTLDQRAISADRIDVKRAKLFIGGEWLDGVGSYSVYDKFSGTVMGEAECASWMQVNSAVEKAQESYLKYPLESHKSADILIKAASILESRRDEIAATITAEAGFPMIDSQNEVTRSAQVLILSAEEGKRMAGHGVPIDASPGNSHRMAFTIRVPRGVVCGITAFNSPLNMVVHKVAPALASGNTVVIKPPQPTPFSAIYLVEALIEAGLPPSHIQLVQGDGENVGTHLVNNQKIAFYTFTGSTRVGTLIRSAIGLRPSAMELGSIAATIVHEDADLERAAPRIANSGFRRAGQACTSTQRLFVHEAIADRFTKMVAAATEALPCGDPHDPKTIVGPMISEKEARRAESWVLEAVAQGARLVTGGTREGALMRPTILKGVTKSMRVMCEEIFAPVLSIVPYSSFDAVIDEVNSTEFGLATGVFTRNIMLAMNAAKRLHVGVVHINEPSSSRVDLMPFAGVKQSGLGREGPKYAMEEMTEERLITISLS
jgi:acyl-CoA reductase-like NAD-dependent aldehyde dehydrogenase